MIPTSLLTCPICSSYLFGSKAGAPTLKCTQEHTFDIAREGYVNLLCKKLPGDTKEMLTRRRQFLEQGHYHPLSDALNDLAYMYFRDTVESAGKLPPMYILDAGCGEGYYLGRLQQYLQAQQEVNYLCLGLDVSKDAIKMAAKRYKEAFFVVANLKERLVFADSTLHAIFNIFAPRNPDEFARVLVPGGLLIIVIPGPTHLLQLRSALHLLSIEENKLQKVLAQFSEHFTLLNTLPIEYELQLCREEVEQVIMMTPNYWHPPPNIPEQICTAVNFQCLLWQRR